MSTFALGLSGGADSAYAALIAYERALNVILVNINGGWSTKEADNNIQIITKYTNYPLYTYDMPESLTRLRKAFLLSDTLFAETPADILYQRMLYDAAREHKVDIIISGMNNTEGNMPSDWSCVDSRLIHSVWRRFGEGMFPDDFPMLSMMEYYSYKKKIWRILDDPKFVPVYKPKEALKTLERIGFQYYGHKHYEDEFTKFNQGLRYWKFGVDVRLINYKALARAGQIPYWDIFKELHHPPYPVEEFMRLCKLVEERIGVKITEEFMTRPMRSWNEFATWRPMLGLLKRSGIHKLFKQPY